MPFFGAVKHIKCKKNNCEGEKYYRWEIMKYVGLPVNW